MAERPPATMTTPATDDGTTPPASALPLRGWRRVNKVDAALVLLALLALVAIVRWRSIWSLYATTQAYVWQQKAIRLALPPDRPVYTEDPAEAQRLAGGDPAYGAARGTAWYIVRPVVEMRRWTTAAATTSTSASLFVRARRAVGGAERLVVVEMLPFAPHGPAGPREFSFRYEVIAPGSPLRFPVVRGADAVLSLGLRTEDRLTVFAGQPDAADASRFTIAYLLNGQRSQIAARLGDDETVTFTPAEGTVEARADGLVPRWHPRAGP